MSSDSVVRAKNVCKQFGDLQVLRGVNMTVQKGEVACILGRSGSGKSTFLRCINHLETIDSGQILVDGHLIGYRQRGNELHQLKDAATAMQRREIGMVFQHFNLFPHLTALENVTEAPTRVAKVRRGTAVTEAIELLNMVGLDDKTHAYPRTLSGGEQQRVAIARALAMNPKLMLFDEPTSALDPQLVGEVLDVIRKLAKDGMTMLVVTHEVKFAQEIADSIYYMDDGVVVEHGSPDDVLRNPRHPSTQEFLSRVL